MSLCEADSNISLQWVDHGSLIKPINTFHPVTGSVMAHAPWQLTQSLSSALALLFVVGSDFHWREGWDDRSLKL